MLGVILALLLSGAAVAGCASTVRIGGPRHSCAPGFAPSNEFGRITAQQRGHGGGVQWGVYPHAAPERFVVDIWINKRRFDHKDQDYPPHGSVPASAIGSGDLFRLEGQAFNARGDVGMFFLTCKAA
jgi:hypothetical protein